MSSTLTKPQITYDEYVEATSKLEIRTGTVINAESIPKSYGLKLTVVFGANETKTVFTNLGKSHQPEEFLGLTFPFIMNVEPSEIKGVLSEVVIIVSSDAEGKTYLKDAPVGSKLM